MDPSEEQSRKIAHQAEKDLNSYPAKVGHGGRILPGYETQTAKGLTGDSTLESGVDTAVENRFDGAKVTYGSAASGAGGNRVIPPEEGGDILLGKGGGRPTKAKDFEDLGGPEDKGRVYAQGNPGGDDVRGNIRQGHYGTGKSGGQS